MSLSRAELEAMDRDELIEQIIGLDRRLSDLQAVVYERHQNQLRDIENENEEILERIAALEARVDPDPAAKGYEELSRSEKVHKLRVALARKAARSSGLNRGRAAMDYNEVLSVFGQHPSPGHAYQLMHLAAGYDPDADESTYPGYEYRSRTDGNDRLRVDLEAVNDDAVFHAVNNATPETEGT